MVFGVSESSVLVQRAYFTSPSNWSADLSEVALAGFPPSRPSTDLFTDIETDRMWMRRSSRSRISPIFISLSPLRRRLFLKASEDAGRNLMPGTARWSGSGLLATSFQY